MNRKQKAPTLTEPGNPPRQERQIQEDSESTHRSVHWGKQWTSNLRRSSGGSAYRSQNGSDAKWVLWGWGGGPQLEGDQVEWGRGWLKLLESSPGGVALCSLCPESAPPPRLTAPTSLALGPGRWTRTWASKSSHTGPGNWDRGLGRKTWGPRRRVPCLWWVSLSGIGTRRPNRQRGMRWKRREQQPRHGGGRGEGCHAFRKSGCKKRRKTRWRGWFNTHLCDRRTTCPNIKSEGKALTGQRAWEAQGASRPGTHALQAAL